MALSKQQRDALEAMDYERVYLTPEGIERLHEKLIRLKKSIVDLAAEAKRTADFGDRSENFEYKQAKGALRGAHRKIALIEDQLKRAVPIKPNTTGIIQLGSTVTLELSDGTQKSFSIVGPMETDPAKNRISHESPLGSALLKHKKGDSVTIQAGQANRTYRIIDVQ